jgi:integrase
MTWADVNGGTIRVIQQKTGTKLTIPLHRELLAVLAAAKRDHVTIINTEYGKPFSVDGFSQWMRAAIKAAGLPLECQPHGLRKAAGSQRPGCSANEIMSMLGHRTLTDAERYTCEADQARLATEAVTKLEGHKANRVPQTAPARFGEKRKNKRNIRAP